MASSRCPGTGSSTGSSTGSGACACTSACACARRRFAISPQHRVHLIKRVQQHLPAFAARDDEFARHENQKHQFGVEHAVYETREEFWFVLQKTTGNATW